MKKLLAILASKFIRLIGKVVGKGSAKPGEIALKIDPQILTKVTYPALSIVVTGTTGKTSTMQTIAGVFEKAGYKVASNTEGANLIDGIATVILDSVKLSGKSKVDALIMEIDERYVKLALKYFTPTYFCVTNLARDQLARNGHPEIVYEDIHKMIKDETHLIINGDDPFIYQMSLDHHGPVSYYGIAKHDNVTKLPDSDTLDMAYCPLCHRKLVFDYYQYSGLGNYHCPNNDFARPKIDYEATEINLAQHYFIINNREKISLPTDIIYNIYNDLVVYAIADQEKIDHKIIDEALGTFNQKVKRFNTFEIDGRKTYVMTSKNETPISYNQSLKYISEAKGKKTLVLGFKSIARHYALRDLSWLWDVNFEKLNNDDLEYVILLGPFADQLAARLIHAGIDSDKMVMEFDSHKALEAIKQHGTTPIYAAVYFDMETELTKEIRRDK